MKNKKTIIFTGGGSGGHAVPAMVLIDHLKESSFLWDEIVYIGSISGIERTLASERNIPYRGILTGKLRRYFSFQNFTDLFNIVAGFFQSLVILWPYGFRQNVLFSTGGFVSVPPVIAARLLGITVYVHEQTSRLGLANKVASFFAKKIFISFESSQIFLNSQKVIYSGYPVRNECYDSGIINSFVEGVDLKLVAKPILFVTGGGNGSVLLNDFVLKNLDLLKKDFFIVHQVGKQHVDKFLKHKDASFYIPLGFINNIIDLYKLSSVVISRAGAGVVSELMALGKKSIFVPLKIAQKNEQYLNAMEACKKIGSIVVREDDLDSFDIHHAILTLQRCSKGVSANQQEKAVDIILKNIWSDLQ